MLLWDNGLVLPEGNLSVDFTRRRPCGFVSHAHGDHLARHELTYCTPETEALARLRLKSKPLQRFCRMRYFEPVSCGGLRLTAYPAGHCLGSAMLLAESQETGKTLLYTGDFKLGPSATSVEAVVPHADYLVMESTFGTPEHRMPPREESIERLRNEIAAAFAEGCSPVVYAYILGKSQEVARLLTDVGFKVQVAKKIHDVCEVYEQCHVPLGDVIPLEHEKSVEDRVLIVPPHGTPFRTPRPSRTFLVSGWAIKPSAKYQFGVDRAIPLSDHADYDDLIRTVEMVAPETVYCTHGPVEFVDRLHDLGFNARPLDRPYQERLF